MSPDISLTILGGGQSIGKSCFLLSIHGVHVLLDCGAYVGKDTKKGLPDFSKLPKNVSVNDISAVLISHFHMDHSGGLVYLVEQLKYKGPILASGPTRAILPLIFKNNSTLLSNQIQSHASITLETFANLVKKIRDVSVRQTIHISKHMSANDDSIFHITL